ncbi:hypothetical protein EGJ55_24155 [Pseudomonas moraviensis]|nr:hypothetical protein EGJ55_24155 [Pseudomonas moraviensis]
MYSARWLNNTSLIVPTLCVGMHHWTLCVRFGCDAERHGLHSHAERGNDHSTKRRTACAH